MKRFGVRKVSQKGGRGTGGEKKVGKEPRSKFTRGSISSREGPLRL